MTRDSQHLLDLVVSHKEELYAVLNQYGATNLRVFGSVARGEATSQSDIDVMVTLQNPQHRLLMRLGGLTEEFRQVLGVNVDVAVPEVLKEEVAARLAKDSLPV